MKKVISLILVLFLSACEFHASSNTNSMQTYTGAGVTFLTPLESSSVRNGDFGIEYEGDSVKARTDGKQLWVNGINYGDIKSGDKVDISQNHKVFVNGAERHPST